MSTNARTVSFERALAALRKGDGLRGTQLCALAGVTYRQLDYWVRTDLVRPSITPGVGSGTQRRYSREDLHLVLILRRCIDTGVSLQRAREAMPMVREAMTEGLSWLVLGDQVVACDAEALAEIVTSMRVCTVVDLGEEAFDLSA